MTPFRCTLEVSPYPDGVTWWLDRAFTYHGSQVVHVPCGFESDWASVPMLFTNILPRWSTYGPAAVIHDWLYWNQYLPRPTADAVFLEAMTALGVSRWKRYTLWCAVRLFGGIAWRQNAEIAAQGYSRIRTKASPKVPEWKRGKPRCDR